MPPRKQYTGEFETEYKGYYGWTQVKVECLKYDTFDKIYKAIKPILEEEAKEMEEYYNKE